MKNTGKCPKCQSTDIIALDNNMGQQLTPIRISAFKVATTARYICCDCGYIEEWVVNPKDLKKLKKRIK